MSSFTSPLVVTPLSDGRDWKLVKGFVYHMGSKFSRHYIKVPAGFKTDFASVPRFLWFLPDWATYSKAPVLHDWLYKKHLMSRKGADEIFLEAMKVDWRNHKSRRWVAYLEYWAVRIFGWWAWQNKGGA